ncbi:MAG TPA: plasmid recombination protein [Candidatus Onthousia excrementipullorum]|uniref:Plasmid recombination protein n=1 Tax=Candidatus Onthousia excrementipullorum TaxID=2840884 RepID=A0A9D1DVU3_9FIRM|nr:plasmid recombination protein [Candidatus Onthousia excrementipullorum]
MNDKEELSYSLHLSNDKNKSKKARRSVKNTETGTTSLSNNAIQNHQQLSKVDKHNLRKYDDDKELICTIKGTSSVVEDTKNLYLELFEDARIKYNEKQTRNDRKIENYFNHISNDNKRDLACEIIIELGDMDFWVDKDDKFKKKMVEVFKEQIIDLEEVVPNFKVANATIHFDESSPHLHIVGVPFKDGMKNGMEKQVGKSDVFNKISLKEIQDKMREYCINSFNRIYHLNYTLKIKEEGRNVDINVANMNEYKKFKREQEKYKKQLKELKNKADELQNKSNEINDIIDNLKPTLMNKNNYFISSENIDKVKKYIEQTNDTTSNLREANDINIVLKKYEDDLREHSNEVRNLKKKIKTRDDRIEELEIDLNDANVTIDELEDKVSELEKIVDYFKELWKKFIEFLQNKFFSNDKYDEIINDLYDEDILDENDIDTIQNNSKGKDDFDRDL